MAQFQSLEHYTERYGIAQWFSDDSQQLLGLYTFRRGDLIYREGDELTHFYFLVEGRTKVYSTHYNGKVTIVEFGTPFDVIGDLEFTRVRSTSLNVGAISDVACVGFPIARHQERLLGDRRFMLNLAQAMGRRIMANTASFTKNQAYPLEQRLARYILLTREGDLFAERLGEIADFLGVSYRHLQRVLSALCGQGVLRRESRCYRILDQGYLEALTDHM